MMYPLPLSCIPFFSPYFPSLIIKYFSGGSVTSDYGSVRKLEGEEESINKKEGTTMTATPATPTNANSSTTQRKSEEGLL